MELCRCQHFYIRSQESYQYKLIFIERENIKALVLFIQSDYLFRVSQNCSIFLIQSDLSSKVHVVLLHQWHCPPIILCKHKSLWLEFVYLLPRVLHVPQEHGDPGAEQRPLVLSQPEFSLTSHLLPKSSGGAGNSVSFSALRATWRRQESELETCSAALESLTAHQWSKCKTPCVTFCKEMVARSSCCLLQRVCLL